MSVPWELTSDAIALQLDAIREETQRLTGEEDAEDSDFEGTPTDSPSTGFGNITDHQGFILGYRSADVDLQKCHPLPSHASFLWSVYQENVEPLIKLLHVPSVELIISDARRNHGKLTPGNEALVFAIYFAAITSLEPDEVRILICSSLHSLKPSPVANRHAPGASQL